MIRFSANLGFLFTDLRLPEAIRAAGRAGFDAVECHFPYDVPPAEVTDALQDTGLAMLGLNTIPGDPSAGGFGLAAVPGREPEARAAIVQAVTYAARIGAANVHVTAGRTDGSARSERTYRSNLHFACDRAAAHDLTILIEPINQRDAPGYHLGTVEHAAGIIRDLGFANLQMMFDCYHVQIMQGDLTRRLEAHLPVIGHVQIAAVPDRGEPDAGEVYYPYLLSTLSRLGYTRPIGAEYRPRSGDVGAGLGWLKAFQAS